MRRNAAIVESLSSRNGAKYLDTRQRAAILALVDEEC